MCVYAFGTQSNRMCYCISVFLDLFSVLRLCQSVHSKFPVPLLGRKKKSWIVNLLYYLTFLFGFRKEACRITTFLLIFSLLVQLGIQRRPMVSCPKHMDMEQGSHSGLRVGSVTRAIQPLLEMRTADGLAEEQT